MPESPSFKPVVGTPVAATQPTHRLAGLTAHHAAWTTILLLALIWRLLGIGDTEVWRDEAVTIIQSKGAWLDLCRRLPWIEDTPPLTFLLFKAWSQLSDAELFLRLLPILLATAWVDVIMRTARLIEPRAWWTTGLLAAFSHVPIHYGQEIRVYSLLALLTALCFYAAQRAIRSSTGRRWLFVCAAFAALAAHAHLSGVFVLPAITGYLLLRSGRRWLRMSSIVPLLLWGLSTFPLVVFARYWSTFHRASIDNWWIQPLSYRSALEIAERLFGLHILGLVAATEQTSFSMWAGFIAGRIILVGCLALVALALLNAERRRQFIPLLCAAALFLLTLFISGCISLPNFADRTVLPAWTPIVLALGVAAAPDTRRRSSRAVCVAVVVPVVIIWAAGWAWNVRSGPPRRPVSNQIFALIRSQIQPQDLIYSWPRWYKEVTVYRLQYRISAEQLLDEYDTYRGSPPRHRLEFADPRDWKARFIATIEDRRNRYRSDFSIWVVHGTLVSGFYPDSPEEYIAREFREVDRYEIFRDKPIGFVRYVPIAASTTQPASR